MCDLGIMHIFWQKFISISLALSQQNETEKVATLTFGSVYFCNKIQSPIDLRTYATKYFPY